LLLVGQGADEGELRGAFIGGDEVDDVGGNLFVVVEQTEPEGAERGEKEQGGAGEEFLAGGLHETKAEGRRRKEAGEQKGR